MPVRPPHIDEKINKYIKNKVPHFFIYAKNKKKSSVEPVNDSPINRLDKLIPNKRIQFKKVAGDFDYRVLMRDVDVKLSENVIEKYEELNKKKRFMIGRERKSKGKKIGAYYVDTYIRQELLKECSDIEKLVDMLVKHLYKNNVNRTKSIIWDSFGDIVVQRVKENVSYCEECGASYKRKRAKRFCESCAQNREKIRLKAKNNRK